MTESSTKYRKERRRKSTFKRFMKTTLLVFTLLILLGGGTVTYMAMQLNQATSSAQLDLERGDRSEIREEPVNPGQDSISILFLGLDDRTGELTGRSDAILLATFNADERSVKMLSIPRDSYVEIPGRGMDKINHAHAYGGIDLAVDTVENLLDIPVDYFTTLNFIAFMEIVDTLGGVEVDVPFSFTEMDSEDNQGAIHIEEGIQTLDGEEALAYARMRKSDPQGDIGRGDRQKDLLESMIREAASFSTITRFGSLMDSLETHMKTNLGFGNIVSMHNYATGMGSIEQLSIEGSNSMINGVFYYDLHDESLNETRGTLHDHLQLD